MKLQDVIAKVRQVADASPDYQGCYTMADENIVDTKQEYAKEILEMLLQIGNPKMFDKLKARLQSHIDRYANADGKGYPAHKMWELDGAYWVALDALEDVHEIEDQFANEGAN